MVGDIGVCWGLIVFLDWYVIEVGFGDQFCCVLVWIEVDVCWILIGIDDIVMKFCVNCCYVFQQIIVEVVDVLVCIGKNVVIVVQVCMNI